MYMHRCRTPRSGRSSSYIYSCKNLRISFQCNSATGPEIYNHHKSPRSVMLSHTRTIKHFWTSTATGRVGNRHIYAGQRRIECKGHIPGEITRILSTFRVFNIYFMNLKISSPSSLNIRGLRIKFS